MIQINKTFSLWVVIALCSLWILGCEATKDVGRTSGRIVGEGSNIVGSISDGGAEAIQGKITENENPYRR